VELKRKLMVYPTGRGRGPHSPTTSDRTTCNGIRGRPQALGITPEAVRMRIKRGTLRSERRAGRVYVLLGLEPNTEHTTDRTPIGHTEELLRTLREQLELERQAHAEARRLLAAALERIPPAIETPRGEESSPSEAREHEGEDRGPTEISPRRLVDFALVSAVLAAFAGALGAVISAAGASLSSTVSSIISAFASIGSSLSGDQVVTIVSAIIGLIGTIGAAYLTVRVNRSIRNRRSE
jgi:hypothetical protein